VRIGGVHRDLARLAAAARRFALPEGKRVTDQVGPKKARKRGKKTPVAGVEAQDGPQASDLGPRDSEPEIATQSETGPDPHPEAASETRPPEPLAADRTPEPLAADRTPEPLAADRPPEPLAADRPPEPLAAPAHRESLPPPPPLPGLPPLAAAAKTDERAAPEAVPEVASEATGIPAATSSGSVLVTERSIVDEKPTSPTEDISGRGPRPDARGPTAPAASPISVADIASSAARINVGKAEVTPAHEPVGISVSTADDGGFVLAPEHAIDQPVPPVPVTPILPTPAEAALAAAQIVSRMVDIDSESGAVIAAAAAAGAAIEAAVAAQKVAAVTASTMVGPDAGGDGLHDVHHDPLSTVRLSRDRILRALHEDMNLDPSARADGRFPRARTEPGVRPAPGEPGVVIDDESYEEFDPVAIAAAAIGRLRARARTDLAELRVHYQRHDLFVILAALVLIVLFGRVHARLVNPPNVLFSKQGLTFEHSAGWLQTVDLPPPPPRLLRDAAGSTSRSKDDALTHIELTNPHNPSTKIEVLIDKKPAWSNIVTGLELDRRTRWGELYKLDDSDVLSIAGHDWLRTAYRYAHNDKGDQPTIDRAVEYATIDREQIYVVTLFGSPHAIDDLEDIVRPTLQVPTQTGLPLVPQTSRAMQHNYPGPIGAAFQSTVMVVVADLVDGRLKARGGGSGVIVSLDGSILTNYHVIHDKDGRLHDVFVIGRYSAPDKAPQLVCAGRPARSKLQRDLDLALVKCDMDLDGRSWNPAANEMWPSLVQTEARRDQVKKPVTGQRLWVLGYPDVGGGGLTISEGEVEGWTGEDGTQGADFIKTDASITHGNSGGPVVNDQGDLVGIASAFRTRVTASGGVIETAQVGLVRPLAAASDLLAIAATGWTPREGHTDVELAPTAVEAAAEGVRISTVILDLSNEAPVRDALLLVLRGGVSASQIDMNRLDDQAIAWGKTNAQGEVRLKQPVPPGTYTVLVLAPGYAPLIGEHELVLDAKTPASYDPWGKILIHAR
jgi:S1-C subfamily serine protease